MTIRLPAFLAFLLAVGLVAPGHSRAQPNGPVVAEVPSELKWTPPSLVPPNLLQGTAFHLDEMSRATISEVEGSPLVLHEALSTALAHNPEIRQQVLSPVVSDAELEARKGVYALTFFADASAAQSVTPQASALAGASDIDLRTQAFGAGLSQPISMSGGSVSLSVENQLEKSSSSFASLSPAYVPVLALKLEQPLLRDLLIDRKRADIRLAELDRSIASLALAQLVRDVAQTVAQDYWELYFAMQQVRINRLAVELAKTLLENDRRRLEVGVLTRPDVLDDEASVARLEDELVRTRSVLRAASDQLRRDLGLPLEGATLLAADLPDAVNDHPGDADALVARALATREELRGGAARVEQRGVEIEAADNDRLPALGLSAGAGLNGLAGSGRAVSFGGDTVVSPFTGSFADSYQELFSGDFYDWSVGVRLSIPLTTDTADREADVARLQHQVAERSLDRLSKDVELEVRRAHDNVLTSAARIGTSSISLDRALENLESEAKRYTLGASRTDDVIRKIDAYARALGIVTRARADHRIANARLERASASSLQALGISVPEAGAPDRPAAADVARGHSEPQGPAFGAPSTGSAPPSP